MTRDVDVHPSLDQLMAANEDAATYFRHQLLAAENSGPRRYLESRGLGSLLEETPWSVGFASGHWTPLHDHLSSLGYSERVMAESGLFLESRRGELLDRFRARITFGVRDPAGHLLGFTARAGPGASTGVPKYLNSPSGRLYDKKQTLFGLGEAHLAGTRATAVIVEGPLDAIAVGLAGQLSHLRLCPVALCGTAMSDRQAELLAALDPTSVVVLLDNDRAGVRAREGVYLHLHDRLPDLRCVTLPTDLDPAGLLSAKGPAELTELVRAPRRLADQLIDDRLSSWPNLHESAETQICCLRETARLVARMRPSDVTRQAGRLQRLLGLSQATVTREIAEAVARDACSARDRDVAAARSSPQIPHPQCRP